MATEVTYKCNEENYIGHNILDGKKFKCEICKLTLWVDNHNELNAHGRTSKTLQHTLLQVKETGVSK